MQKGCNFSKRKRYQETDFTRWRKAMPYPLVVSTAFGGVAAGFLAIPILFTLVNSFSTGMVFSLLPQRWSLNSWFVVFLRRPPYLVKFWSSLVLSVSIVTG